MDLAALRRRLALLLAPELAPKPPEPAPLPAPYITTTEATSGRSYLWIPGDWKGTA